MAKAKSAMAHPLYLTADEKKLFDKLPASLKEGWEVKEERGEYEDSDKKLALRMTFMTVQDPNLKKARSAQTLNEIIEFAKSIDLSKVSEDDVGELFFAMGSDGMTTLIKVFLRDAKTDDDVNGICFISGVRHGFYESAPVSA